MLSITLTVVDVNRLLVFNLQFQEMLHLDVKSVTLLLRELEASVNGAKN